MNLQPSLSDATARGFAGVYPVLYAFFDRDGALDPQAMERQVEHCVEQGAHGITVLGLVTEVHKLATAERRDLVALVGRLLRGRLPYAVTIAEPEVASQLDFAAHARACGADWVILQPPPGSGHTDEALAQHFRRVADGAGMPVAVQNNPVNLASAMSPEALARLVRSHPNIRILKAEGWSVDIARVIEACEGQVAVFGGHGGLEYLSLLRSGGRGLIPAPDCLALQAAMHEAYTSGDPARRAAAERVHKEILPLVVLMTRSLAGILTYGKRVMARRLGLGAVHDRAPSVVPTRFGLAETERVLADVLEAETRWLPALRGQAPLPLGT